VTATPAPGPATAALWEAARPVFDAVLVHPFVTGLVDGTLSRDAFRTYVVQDSLYLRAYARALAVCGARAPHEDQVVMFCEHASGALAVERSLHAGFLAELGVTAQELAGARPTPTTLAYTSYLLATVSQASFPEAVAAVLPCYWVYAEVGEALLERGSPDPLHRRWIDTYGGEEFGGVVRAVLGVAEEAFDRLPEPAAASVREHYTTTTRYEWMFWDAAWRRERWPV